MPESEEELLNLWSRRLMRISENYIRAKWLHVKYIRMDLNEHMALRLRDGSHWLE